MIYLEICLIYKSYNMDKLELQVSEKEIQEIPCTKEIETDTKEEVKLLTMGREWTKTERLKYLEFRKQEENNKKRKWKRYTERKEKKSKVKSKPKKSSGRVKLWDGRITDTHHILAKSRIWSNNRVNLKEFNIKKHQALHTLFWNAYPHEMLNQILEFSEQVLHPDTKEMIIEEIQALIEYYLKYDEFYNPLAIKQ